MHMLSKKDLSSGELDTLKRSRPPTTVVTANGEVQTNEEAQVCVHVLHVFVTVQLVEDTPAVLSLGKLCKERGYTCEWPSCREPRLTKNEKQTCKNESFVPSEVPGLSSPQLHLRHRPQQDLSFPSDPANTRSNEEVAGNCNEQLAGHINEGIPEWLEDFK